MKFKFFLLIKSSFFAFSARMSTNKKKFKNFQQIIIHTLFSSSFQKMKIHTQKPKKKMLFCFLLNQIHSSYSLCSVKRKITTTAHYTKLRESYKIFINIVQNQFLIFRFLFRIQSFLFNSFNFVGFCWDKTKIIFFFSKNISGYNISYLIPLYWEE